MNSPGRFLSHFYPMPVQVRQLLCGILGESLLLRLTVLLSVGRALCRTFLIWMDPGFGSSKKTDLKFVWCRNTPKVKGSHLASSLSTKVFVLRSRVLLYFSYKAYFYSPHTGQRQTKGEIPAKPRSVC